MEKCFDISGLGVRFDGLPAEVADQFRGAWPLFESAGLGETFLDVDVRIAGDPVPDGTVSARSMRTSFDESGARFAMQEGTARADASGSFEVRLAPSGASTQFVALVNLTLAGLAWRLSRRRGAVLHSATILLRDRAVVLVGASGSGKSTWARLAVEAGVRSLGDDLILLDGSRGRIEALSNPIRRQFGSLGPGRWPLAAGMLPHHGSAARLDPVERRLVAARIVANLPWVADTLSAPLNAFIDELIAEVPFRRLTFAEDPSFVPLLERFLDE